MGRLWLHSPHMKIKLLLALVGAAILAVGCVKTVNDRNAAGMPGLKNKFVAQYPRTVDQVFNAARTVLKNNGTVERESILTATNTVKVLEGKVNKAKVWMRVEDLSPSLTQLSVQALGSWGGTDQEITHQLDKEIALELTKQ